MIGITGSLMWSKTLMELIFIPRGEFRRIPEGPVSHIHSPHHHAVAPGIFFRSFKVSSKAKERVGAENGKLQHLFIPIKTATFIPELPVEDLPLGRNAALVAEFALKDLPLGRTL